MKNKHRYIYAFIVIVLTTMACSVTIPRTLEDTTPNEVIERIPESNYQAPTIISPTIAPVVIPPGVTDEQSVLVSLYARLNPSVVNIMTYAEQGEYVSPMGQGSGFVYDAEGHIVTNAHVVDGADQLEVTFSDTSIVPADLVGKDLNSDLAVIRPKRLPAGTQPIPLGDMEGLAVGQTVAAIGNPFGLQGTLTRGIISALGRDIPALTLFNIPQAIQTDAAINPGNSGGPLLNLQGEVIGINAQIETSGLIRSNSGVGFAVPVSIIKRVIPDLVRDGRTEWAWLGVTGGSVNPDIVQAMELPIDKGAYVSKVNRGGPADRAGIRGSTSTKILNKRQVETGGDVITAVDGGTVANFDDLLIYLAMQTRPNQKVTLTIIRNGESRDVEVTLGERPESVTSEDTTQ